jgi:predicted peroxiredoxin
MPHAIVIMAPEETPEGRGRIIHALHTARDLAANNEDVGVFFEGIGVTCLTAFAERANPFTENYGPLFDEVKPLVRGACDFCARRRFNAADAANSLDIDLIGGVDQHHSLADLIAESWVVTTF